MKTITPQLKMYIMLTTFNLTLLLAFSNTLFVFAHDSTAYFHYQQAFSHFKNKLIEKETLCFEDAIFEIENAFYNHSFSKIEFKNTLDFHTHRIVQLAHANKNKLLEAGSNNTFNVLIQAAYDDSMQFLLNWAIYTYLSDTTWWKNGNNYIPQLPMQYDNSNTMNIEDWPLTQVSSLLHSHQGNCFSLASLFYIFSQRLQSNAYLVAAPGHLYIQHKGLDDNYYNIELGTQSFPESGSIKTSTQTTHQAILQGYSMRRLSPKNTIALCLVQLAESFRIKQNDNGELTGNDFVLQCASLAMQYDPLCFNALLLNTLAQNKILSLNNDEKAVCWIEEQKLNELGYNLSCNNMQSCYSPFETIDPSIAYLTLSNNGSNEIYPQLNFNQDYLRSYALSIDPLYDQFPSTSPYAAMGSDPINFIDPTGMAAITADQLMQSAESKPEIQKGTVALFVLTATLHPGDILSGTELINALPSKFASTSPNIFNQLSNISSLTMSAEGVISVQTKNGEALAFGDEKSGFIVVENGASFRVTETTGTLRMSSVRKIVLSKTSDPGIANSTALKGAAIKGSTGDATLDGALSDIELNFGELVIGQ